MIYNIRHWSNDTTENQKEKRPVLILILKALYSWKKMWSLKILAMLKCESRTSLHVVQCK